MSLPRTSRPPSYQSSNLPYLKRDASDVDDDSVVRPSKRRASGATKRHYSYAMEEPYERRASTGVIPQSETAWSPLQHTGHLRSSESHQRPSLALERTSPWPMPDFASSEWSNAQNEHLGPYLQYPQSSQSALSLNFEYPTTSSPTSLFAQGQFMGVPTPDQSPHTLSLSVAEGHTFPSEPTRTEAVAPATSTAETGPVSDDDLAQIRRALKSSSPVQRSDGVKKRNAKYEIPEGQNVMTIESMIRKETDPETVRTLKQHKRLLKNREAALQSRYRKKEYTQKLEQELKELAEKNSQLEDRIRALQAQRTRFIQPSIEFSGPPQHAMGFFDGSARHFAPLRAQGQRLQSENQWLHQENTRLNNQLRSFNSPSGNLDLEGNNFDVFHDIYLNSEQPEQPMIKKDLESEATAFETIEPAASSTLMLNLVMYGAHMASALGRSVSQAPLTPAEVEACPNILNALFAKAGFAVRSSRLHLPVVDFNNLTSTDHQAVTEFKSFYDTANEKDEQLTGFDSQ